jgi:hypothetical protein
MAKFNGSRRRYSAKKGLAAGLFAPIAALDAVRSFEEVFLLK